MSDQAPSAFEIANYDSGNVPGLTVLGELDMASGPGVADLLFLYDSCADVDAALIPRA